MDILTFLLISGTIQTNIDDVSFSYKYALQIECDEINNNGTALLFDSADINFEITFHDLCGVTDKTLEPTQQTEHTTTNSIPLHEVLAMSSNWKQKAATVSAKRMFTHSAWQSKTEIIVATKQLPYPADRTHCNSNVDGIFIGPVMVAVVTMVIVITELSTAVGCYCLGYKRCLPLPTPW